MAIVYIALKCPVCRRVNAVHFSARRIVAMLASHELIDFYSPCHNALSQPTVEERRAMIEAAIPPFGPPANYQSHS
jgi:hypothetical protein